MLDCYAYTRGRVEQVLSPEGPATMVTQLRVLSVDGRPVKQHGGGVLDVDGAAGGDQPYSFIWIPAFLGGDTEAMARRMAALDGVCRWLREQARGGAIVGASGIAALVPIAARLVDNVAVPIAPSMRPLVRALFPRAPIDETATFVESGQLLFSSGHAHDYTLIIRGLERVLAPSMARWLRSIVGLPDRMQRQPVDDLLMHSASLWLDQRFATHVSISELAAEHSLSHSALSRRFRKAFGMSPKAYVQQARVKAAQHQLESTNRSIDTIATLCGFSDARLFRAAFRQYTGMTASEWRRRHTAPPSA